MLYDYTKYFLYYLYAIYGGEWEVRGTTLWLWNERDEFHVNLLDGSRFSKFNLIPFTIEINGAMSNIVISNSVAENLNMGLPDA